MTIKTVILALAAALLGACPAAAQPNSAMPAIDGVLAAFQTHQLVGIGDIHGTAQEFDFWNALVRDPRFAKEVGNVVVEFGGAAHQDIIDRYVNGEDVSYADFRKVISDTVGWVPTVPYLGYPNFFAQVRTVNMGLAAEDRIHVWLGEPVIDWTKIKSKADYDPILATRDSHAADIIIRNILSKGRKALVLYGDGHFDRATLDVAKAAPTLGSEAKLRKYIADLAHGTPDYGSMTDVLANRVRIDLPMWRDRFAKLGALQSVVFDSHDPPGADGFDVRFANGALHVFLFIAPDGKLGGGLFKDLSAANASLVELIDAEKPGVLYLVEPWLGFDDKGCEARFAAAEASWTTPSLVTPDPRKNLGTAMAGCVPRGLAGDALLYMGPADRLAFGPSLPDTYLDPDFRKEIARRQPIIGGPTSYAAPPRMENVPMTPTPLFPQ